MKMRQAIAKDVLAMWTSIVLTQFVGFFLAIFIRRELGPEQMGVWALLQVFLGYSSYASLGVYDAALREIPLCRGKNDLARAELVRDVAFTFTMVSALAVSALILVYLVFFGAGMSPLLFWGILSMAALNTLQRWNNFLIGFLYIEKQFELAGRFKTYSAVANAFFVIIGVSLLALYGFYLAMIVSFIYNIVYLNWKFPVRFHWRWDGNELRRLTGLSVTLLIVGGLNTLLTSADRLVIGKFLGLNALGVYTLATMGSGFVLMFAYMFSATIYPRVLEKYGQKGDVSEVLRVVTLPSLFLSAYLSIAVGLMWALAPWLTGRFLPKYANGLPALSALMIGTVFLALINQTNQMILAVDRQRRMIGVYLFSLAAAVPLFSLVVHVKGGVEVYAAATALSFFIVYTFQTFFGLHGVVPFLGRAALWARTVSLISLSAGLMLLMDVLWPQASAAHCAWRSIFFILPALAISWSVEKEVRLVSVVRDFLTARRPLEPIL